MLEVWVLDKVYKLKRQRIAEIVEALLNTPNLKCELEQIFRRALKDYADKNIKFADAVIAYQGLSDCISIVYTYDEKDFKRIGKLEVRKP